MSNKLIAPFLVQTDSVTNPPAGVVSTKDYAYHAFKIIVTELLTTGKTVDQAYFVLDRNPVTALQKVAANHSTFEGAVITDIVITRLLRTNPAAEEFYYTF